MKKRRWILATALLASIIGGPLIVLSWLPPRPGVTIANFRRIEDGMTMNDAFLIFSHGKELPPRGRWWAHGMLTVFHGRDGEALFACDEDGTIIRRNWQVTAEPTVMEQLSRLIGWRSEPSVPLRWTFQWGN